MAERFRVRDPVHHFVHLRDAEVTLIATPIFQRLRGIRQLAMAHLVYPGALHTRFDHSLGVCHVAGLLAEQLGLSADEIELVRQAALLHDLGHGPFSHVSEHLLDWYADREKLPTDQKKEKIHELITAHFIQTDPDIQNVLGKQRCEQIVSMLTVGHGQPALRAIVSGPLDADKQDYLLRDSHFCGVPYGLFDIHQLHRSLVLYGPDDEKELMIDPDGIHAVEQYVLAKYYLTTNVYRHRVRLITDQMIVRAIRLGIDEDGMGELARIYRYDSSSAFFDNYRTWDDARLLGIFGADDAPGRYSGELLRRLRQRRLLKRVFVCPLHDLAEETRVSLQRMEDRENARERAELEKAIAEKLSSKHGRPVEPRFVIVHTYTIRSVRVASRNDEGKIMVARDPAPRPFEQEPALFASISEGYTEGYVEVYAPIAWQTMTDRKRIRRELDEPIRDCLQAPSPRPVQERQT